MIERHSKVFVPVSVEDKLPSIDLYRFIAMTQTGYASMFRRSEPNDEKHRDFLNGRGITHWLEEKENVYVLTEDELGELFKEYSTFFVDNPLIPYDSVSSEFLKSKTNPQTEKHG